MQKFYYLSLQAKHYHQFMNKNEGDVFLLDVRTPGEFNEGHLEGAINIPIQTLANHLDEVPENKIILVYCLHGIRSGDAALFLKQNRYEKVYHVSGGLTEVERSN